MKDREQAIAQLLCIKDEHHTGDELYTPTKVEPLATVFDKNYASAPTISQGRFLNLEVMFDRIQPLNNGDWLCCRIDGNAEIRRLDEQAPVAILDTKTQTAAPLRFYKEFNEQILLINDENILSLWDKQTYQCLMEVNGTDCRIIDAVAHQGKLVTFNEASEFIIWDTQNLNNTIVIDNNPIWDVFALHVTQAGQLAAIKCTNEEDDAEQAIYQVYLIDTATGTSSALPKQYRCGSKEASVYLFNEKHHHFATFEDDEVSFDRRDACLRLTESLPWDAVPGMQVPALHHLKAKQSSTNNQHEYHVTQTGDIIFFNCDATAAEKTNTCVLEHHQYPSRTPKPDLTQDSHADQSASKVLL